MKQIIKKIIKFLYDKLDYYRYMAVLNIELDDIIDTKKKEFVIWQHNRIDRMKKQVDQIIKEINDCQLKEKK